MLTKSEKEWLKKREQWAEPHNGYGDEGYFCEHCKINCIDGCPTEIRDGNIDAFVDAAEFSERVTAKLAEFYHHTTLYLDDSDGQKLRCWETCPARFHCGDSYTHLTCGDAVLKTAQLTVEEEMNGKKDSY